MHILLALPAAFALATFAPVSAYRDPPLPRLAEVRAEPVPLDMDQPRRGRVGALSYLGGWALRSNDHRFGGISALHVADGQVLAAGDQGLLFRFAIPTRAGSTPLAIQSLSCGPTRLKKQRDVESMLVRGDDVWLGFEFLNAICRYRLPGWRRTARAQPPAMKEWWDNQGAEAIARLADGRFLVFAEGPVHRGTSALLLFPGDPAAGAGPPTLLRYRPPAGFKVTDAAILPDGRLLVLHRRFSMMEGVAAILSVVRLPARPVAASVIEGRALASLAPPLAVDNMEGIGIGREAGRTIVWLASDDNYIPLQRTLLLKFALAD